MSITSISCRQVIGNALSRMHMRCLGHTQRPPDERLVKQMLYGCVLGQGFRAAPSFSKRGSQRLPCPHHIPLCIIAIHCHQPWASLSLNNFAWQTCCAVLLHLA